MKMIDYLEKDKDRVLTGLRGSSTPAGAQEILEKEADRLLLQYNEDCTSIRVRDAASGMMQTLRSSVPFMDTMGEPRIWSQKGGGQDSQEQAKAGRLPGILLIIGVVLVLAACVVPALSAGSNAGAGTVLRGIVAAAAGGGCLYLAGRTSGRQLRVDIKGGGGPGNTAGTERIEITIDPEKLWNSLRGAVMVIDRNLEAAEEEEALARRKELTAAGGNGLSAEEVELFSGLLETADAESPQMAADIRYYLHKKGVEAVGWSPQYSAWFELLPAPPGAGSSAGPDEGEHAATVRPALVQAGKLLKKGIAVK